jgi:RNA polymerase sigma-70 factor (ECF subfamily)
MLAQVDQSFDSLLQRARAGDTVALGCLLDSCRAYLKLIAASLLRTASRASVDVSDVVQETNLKAYVKFPTFQKNDEGALVAWLRTILTNVVLNLLKDQGRPGRRPESLDALLQRASEDAHRALTTPGSTPSAQASRREQAVLVANALELLKPRHKQVLVLRHLEGLGHEEIAKRMGISEGRSRNCLLEASRELGQRLRELS